MYYPGALGSVFVLTDSGLCVSCVVVLTPVHFGARPGTTTKDRNGNNSLFIIVFVINLSRRKSNNPSPFTAPEGQDNSKTHHPRKKEPNCSHVTVYVGPPHSS